MYDFFIGSDMSKSTIDVSYHNGSESIYLGEFKNNNPGFKKLVTRLKQFTHQPCKSWFVCFENTGVYSKAFLEWLISKQIPCREENALKIARSTGLKRGKNDKVDSKDICSNCYASPVIWEKAFEAKQTIPKLLTETAAYEGELFTWVSCPYTVLQEKVLPILCHCCSKAC